MGTVQKETLFYNVICEFTTCVVAVSMKKNQIFIVKGNILCDLL